MERSRGNLRRQHRAAVSSCLLRRHGDRRAESYDLAPPMRECVPDRQIGHAGVPWLVWGLLCVARSVQVVWRVVMVRCSV